MIQLRLLEHRLLRYAGITAGCLIASSSINLFLVPSHLLTGGATGIAMIVYYLTHLPIGAQTFAYNIPLLMAAWRLLGRGYTFDVIIGTAIFSFCLDITRPLNAYAPVNDYMLAAIFGGVFNGIGYGIVFRMNGSTGGFDIVGAIAKKFYSFNMGGVIFGFNCLVMLAAAFMFGVAPAMIVFNVLQPCWVAWAAMLIAVCGALRLARFNVDTRQSTTFTGLPIPGNAIFWIGASAWLAAHPATPAWLTLAVIVLVSWLMVSPLRMFSLKVHNLSPRENWAQLALIAGAVVLVCLLGIYGLAATIALYVALSIVKHEK